jgi:heterotetrameric sarcosine oxidase gamma subunit
VSLDFLSPAPSAIARSPMEREALAAGATLEQRDGWNVAVDFEGEERHRSTVAFADRSQLGKLELQGADLGALAAAAGSDPLELGRASRAGDAWICPVTSDRALVLCEPAQTGELRDRLGNDAVDLTSAMGALTIAGPLAPEVFARFTAIDLRPQATPVHGFRPGSVARTPGAILREAEDRWLMLFGAALGSYVWTVVADAAASLGGGPVGADALVAEEVAPRA